MGGLPRLLLIITGLVQVILRLSGLALNTEFPGMRRVWGLKPLRFSLIDLIIREKS